jgi:hypothetical protein
MAAPRSTVRRVGRVVLGMAFVASVLGSSISWIRLETMNFELYSTLDPKRAMVLLNQLADAKQILARFIPSGTANPGPVRVIAFRSQTEYNRFRTNEAAAAYYLHTHSRDYIVLGEDALQSYEPAIHEYVHYVLHQRFKSLPLWLDEGLAEVYSTIDQKNGVIRVGLPSQDEIDWLRMDGFAFDLPALFRTTERSFDHAAHLTPRSRFYAESWLLVHMLRFSSQYSSRFNEFLTGVASGEDAKSVLHTLYGKTFDDITADLKAYLAAERMPTDVVRLKPAQSDSAVEVSTPSAGEIQAVLNDLVSARKRVQETEAVMRKASP